MREQTWGPGSAAVVDYILRPGGLDLSPEGRLVYLALWSHMNEDGQCFPSIPRLAQGIGLAPRTVQRRVRELESVGLIRRTGSPGRVSEYKLYPPWDPCQTVTRVRESPVTHRHQRQPDAAPVSESHHTPVTLTPEVTHISNPGKKPSIHPDEERAPAGEESAGLWTRVVGSLRSVMPAHAIEVLESCSTSWRSDGALVVAAPANAYKRAASLRVTVRQTVQDLTGRRPEVTVVEQQPPARAGPEEVLPHAVGVGRSRAEL